MIHNLTTKLVALLLVLNFAVFGTFLVVLVVLSSSAEEKTTEEYMNIMLSDKVETLQINLKSVESEARDFANMAMSASYSDNYNSIYRRGYIVNDQGMLESKSDTTSVYLPKGKNITEEIKQEIASTETLIELMQTISRNNNNATTYITTENGFLRVYPYMDNNVFDPAHDQTQDPFYQIANTQNDLRGEAKWTKPYFDYAGNGWIITCSCPFYEEGRLKGVVSIDLPLETLYGTLKSFQMGDEGYAFAIDYNGNIIYHPRMTEQTEKRGETYENKYESLYKNNRNRADIVAQMMKADKGYAAFNEDGKRKVIAFKKLDYIDWIIGIEVNTSEMASRNLFLPAGVWITLILSCILVIISGWMISRKITRPIRSLTAEVKNSDEELLSKVTVSTDDEIGVLATAFNSMIEKINQYTSSLMETNNTLQSVFDAVSDTLMVIDSDLNIIKSNNVTADESLTKIKCYKLLHNLDVPCKNCPVAEKNEDTTKRDVTTRNKIFGVNSYKVIDEQNGDTHYVVTEVEITQNVLMEKELMQNEKMAEVGRLVAGLTHELKNPLSVIKGCSYLLKKSDAENLEIICEIDESISRANKIVMSMLNFSKSDYDESKMHNVKEHIDQILMLLREDLVEKKISYETSNLEDLTVFCKGDSLKHIFINLITNAIEAMKDGGRLLITGQMINGITEIKVRNNGPQISDEEMTRIFEPFFTTKKNGTGLGLWIVANEVRKYNGEIEIANINGGVEATVKINSTPEEREMADEQS